MSKFFSFFLVGLIFLLLIAGFLIFYKNNGLTKVLNVSTSIKDAFQNLFGSNYVPAKQEVATPIVKKEDLEEETIEKEKFEENSDFEQPSPLDEIVEKIDEISEKVDLLTQEVESFIEERNKVENVEKVEEIEEEAEKIEEIKEELEEPEEDEEGEEKAPEKEIILCQKGIQNPVRDKVIFNEISWMGTTTDWRNEWMELKNLSGNDISLGGWQVLDKEQEIKIIFEEKDNILPGQLFLLERTNDDSVSGILADKIYSGNLNDTEEALYLFDENCQLQDEALTSPNWPAGDKEERKSMERDLDFNWYTFSGSANNAILGTPKTENSQKLVFTGPAGGAPPVEELPTTLPKILISEIFFDAEGSDENQEFVELFNPNDSELDFSDYSLQYLSPNSNSIDKIEKKNFEKSNKIAPKDYFLIGLNGREGDIKWSKSLGNTGGTVVLVNNKELISGDNDENVVDRIGYGSGEGLILPETSAITLENFEAGKSLGRKWLEDEKEYQDIDNNQEDFEIQDPTPKEKNENLLPPLQPIVEDNIAPQVSFNSTSSLQTETSFSLSWVGQDLAPENATPSGIDAFYLQYKVIPSDIDGIAIQYQDINNNWQEWGIGQILDFEENKNNVNLLTEEGIIYSFQIKAKDKVENESDWLELIVEANTLPVVINEIAWMGGPKKEGETSQQAADNEWLELFNNTNQDIDLTGWILKAADGTPEISLKGVILAKSFYLLERADDNTIPEITADQIYKGALGNSGEDFKIFNNSGKLIDSVAVCEGKWCAGDNDTKQTMERKDPKASGSDPDNWNASQEAGGTPKAQNSQ